MIIFEKMRAANQKGDHVDITGVIQQIFQLASRQTAARLISDADANWPTIEKNKQRFGTMPGADEVNEQNDGNLSANIKNLNEAWNNFMSALGDKGVPAAINILQALTSALNYMQKIVVEHPDWAQGVFYMAAALGSLLVLQGSILLFTAALGPFRLALAALTGIQGLAAVGGSLGGVAGGLSSIAGIAGLATLGATLGGVAAGILGILKIGSDAEKEPGYPEGARQD